METTDPEFMIDDIFHRVCFLKLTEVQPGIPQNRVREIIFIRSMDVFLSLDVIADSRINQKGITRRIDIFFYCGRADVLIFSLLNVEES